MTLAHVIPLHPPFPNLISEHLYLPACVKLCFVQPTRAQRGRPAGAKDKKKRVRRKKKQIEADVKRNVANDFGRDGTGPRGRPRGAKDVVPRRRKTLPSEGKEQKLESMDNLQDSLELYNRAHQQVVAGM